MTIILNYLLNRDDEWFTLSFEGEQELANFNFLSYDKINDGTENK